MILVLAGLVVVALVAAIADRLERGWSGRIDDLRGRMRGARDETARIARIIDQINAYLAQVSIASAEYEASIGEPAEAIARQKLLATSLLQSAYLLERSADRYDVPGDRDEIEVRRIASDAIERGQTSIIIYNGRANVNKAEEQNLSRGIETIERRRRFLFMLLQLCTIATVVIGIIKDLLPDSRP